MALSRRATLRAALGAVVLPAAVAGCASPAASTQAPTSSLPSPSLSPAARLPAEAVHGPRTRRAVALTFHGQGSPSDALALLEELERAATRASVFVVGSWLEEQPMLARRILDGGHELANHTYSHTNIAALNPDAAYAEIDRCAAVLRRLTGSIGAWFRPSQIARTTPMLIAAARRAGYPTTVAYDVDSLDYTDPGPAAIVSTVLDAVQPGSIVSLHLGHAGTIAAMPAILEDLRSRNLGAVTATELLA
jgi:peptidoglycan/xylan/chitin deacetylase (PgdA/CDA1 family)